jgi:hypothetical protein
MVKRSLLVFILGVQFFQSEAQQTYYRQTNGGLCDATILLFPDSIYNIESGCEASSRFNFGRWAQKKDTIIFQPVDPRNYKVVKSVHSKQTGDSLIMVVIRDREGNNITAEMKPRQYVKGKGFYSFTPDSGNSYATDYKRDSGVIRLLALERLFKKPIAIPVTAAANYYEITVDISPAWIIQKASEWEPLQNFKMLKKKDNLVSLKPDTVDEDWNLVHTVYLLQK